MVNSPEDGANAWLRSYHPADESRTRLVCFPHAGGSATFFQPISANFSPTVEVLAIQYPGRQDRRREPGITDLATLADRVATRLASLPAKPAVFFGHGLGAAVAFEVTHRLERLAAGAPECLIVSGRRSPSTRRDDPIHHHDDNGIIAEIRRLNGTDSALLGDDELLRMAMPVIRSDYRAGETYLCRPGLTVACPITVLLGERDPQTTLDEARGWQAHTTSGFRLKVFDGGHFYLSRQQAAVHREIADGLDGLSAAVRA